MNTETWIFINTFAPWLSAVGTISAVIVSLYLSRAEKPIKLEIRAGHRISFGPGTKEPYPEYLYISAINTGHRIITITNVGWKIGLLKKRYAIQMVQSAIGSSSLPVKVDDGQEAKWLVPLDLKENWIERFSKEFLQPNPRWNLLWVKLQVHTSIGKTFETRIEKGLRDILLEECKKQMNKKA